MGAAHSFKVNGAVDCDMAEGVYGDITKFTYEFLTQLKTAAGMGNSEAEFTEDFLFSFGDLDLNNDPAVFTIAWTDDQVRQILGFAGALGGAKVYTAAFTPLYCWKAAYVRADRNRFRRKHTSNWRGATAQSGNTVGLTTGANIYAIEIELQDELNYRLYKSAGPAAARQNRSMDEFVAGSREAYPTSGNVSPAGFYYYPDYTDIQPRTAAMDAGSAEDLELTSSPEEYVFCNFDEDWDPDYPNSIPAGVTYYKVKVPFHTAEIPTGGWDAP